MTVVPRPTVEVLLIDDQAILLEAIVESLSEDQRIQIVGAAGTAADASRMIGRIPANVALVDMMLPDAKGEKVIGEIRKLAPQTRCVAISADESDEMLVRALHSGAAGFLPKGAGTLERLASAVLEAAAGSVVFPVGRLRGALAQIQAANGAGATPVVISPETLALLNGIADQLNDPELADRAGIAPADLALLLDELLATMHVDSRLQAVVAAARLGLV